MYVENKGRFIRITKEEFCEKTRTQSDDHTLFGRMDKDNCRFWHDMPPYDIYHTWYYYNGIDRVWKFQVQGKYGEIYMATKLYEDDKYGPWTPWKIH